MLEFDFSGTLTKDQFEAAVYDVTDDKLIDQVSGNAALNGVPVRVRAA